METIKNKQTYIKHFILYIKKLLKICLESTLEMVDNYQSSYLWKECTRGVAWGGAMEQMLHLKNY